MSPAHNHEEIMYKLGTLEEGQRVLLRELMDVKMMAIHNRRDINLAKGGSVFATLAATIVGIMSYFYH